MCLKWKKVTYVLETCIVILADVVQFIDENVVVLAKEVNPFSDSLAR